MKCYLHIDEEVVAQCQACSRGLCTECSNLFQNPTCQNCAAEQNRQYRNDLLKRLLLSGGVFFLVFTSMANDVKGHPLAFSFIVSYVAASIPWGWSVLNRFTPNVFLILPLAGWLFYFGFKFYLSGMVGIFITPIKIYSAIRDIREISRRQLDLMSPQPAELKLIK